nr:hypothetical protein [Streptomyces gelaticus]
MQGQQVVLGLQGDEVLAPAHHEGRDACVVRLRQGPLEQGIHLAVLLAPWPEVVRLVEEDRFHHVEIDELGHLQGLGPPRHAVLDWLDHRRSRWPNTANPHLLITQKTAVELGPVGKLWTTRATRNLTVTLERLRVDRQLEEASPTAPTPFTSPSFSASTRRPPSATRTPHGPCWTRPLNSHFGEVCSTGTCL